MVEASVSAVLRKEFSTMKKTYTVIQISDPHLSGARAYNYRNWKAALEFVNAAGADLTVCTGDVVLDDPDVEDDLAYARSQLDLLNGPWLVLPGNHDIGDSKPKPYMGQIPDKTRLAAWRKYFGEDRWNRRLGEWRLIGVNALILDSDLPEEEEQYDWLRMIVRDDHRRPTALFLHKPLFIDSFDEDVQSHWCVTPEGRRRLWSILEPVNIPLMVCGHTHHFRTMTVDGITMVWAPATGHIDFNDPIPFNALRTAGLIRYRFGPNGVEYGLVIPEGMATWNAAEVIRDNGSMRNAPLLYPETVMEGP